jgi:hypothetical protein
MFIPATGSGGTYICETSWLLHFLEYQLTDDDEVVSFKQRLILIRRKIPGSNLYPRVRQARSNNATGSLDHLKNLINISRIESVTSEHCASINYVIAFYTAFPK